MIQNKKIDFILKKNNQMLFLILKLNYFDLIYSYQLIYLYDVNNETEVRSISKFYFK